MSEPVPAWAQEPGLSQVICHCTGEHFVFLVSDVAARLVCVRCQAVNGEFSRRPDQPLVTFDNIAPMAPGMDLPRIPPPSEVRPPEPPSLHAGAAWGDPPSGPGGGGGGWALGGGGGVVPSAAPDHYAVAHLPEMSPGNCNTYLRGGPLDGQLTYVPPDVTTYVILGAGSYYRTLEVHDGRTVYLHKG